MTMNTYEIGGLCVTMTRAQATAWNEGNVTAEVLAGATMFIPSRHGAKSYLRDGEVIVDSGLPTGESVDLWTAIDTDGESTKLYDEYMDGMPATLTREGRDE